jgi:1,4-alpha-glucan branching enzyme
MDEHGVATEVEQIVEGRHANPHHILGLHATAEGMVVRTYRPEAERVRVLVGEEVRATLARNHEAGVFEGVVAPPGEPVGEYLLEVSYPEGAVFRLQDPYRFPPTLGDLDLHLVSEGRHEELYRRMGARVVTVDGVRGTSFVVWAPNARSVRVIGEFNGWDGRLHPMRSMGGSGVWELFLPDVGQGSKYKFEILTAQGWVLKKADPYARCSELPPATAGVVFESSHNWTDGAWMESRRRRDLLAQPISVYEVHLGSWRRGEGDRVLGYRECADMLAEYCTEMGFTHVEFLPLAEHPFGPSWGYQVSYYYAPTARHGGPDDLRYLVDRLHRDGIGVIMDWVPAHFPRDDWALARYDGTALYEHADPRQGEHPDWGTLVFNFGRNEVRNFLIANALYWLDEFHVDGLRVDAVASMLYLDYSRKEGEWVPNRHGGRENIEAIQFLRELNAVVHAKYPGVMMIAEESTAWGGVSRPTWTGGLGFGFKWNMGWMHDTLDYFSKDPVYRRFHHHQLTFALIYAWHENFILPLSHDEVVHGKGSLAQKMPGDRWQQLANLRSLYGYMWAHPGKQMLFMGGEFAQSSEWNHARSLDWHLLDYEEHRGIQRLVRDLNRRYREESALWEVDFEPAGFQWIDANNSDDNVFAYLRWDRDHRRCLACVANLAPVVRHDFRLGLPRGGRWSEVLNTDAAAYGGANLGNAGSVHAGARPWHGQPFSAALTLPPLAAIWLVPAE